jgi:hypothetical protein
VILYCSGLADTDWDQELPPLKLTVNVRVHGAREKLETVFSRATHKQGVEITQQKPVVVAGTGFTANSGDFCSWQISVISKPFRETETWFGVHVLCVI